jgi:hypothetical protein
MKNECIARLTAIGIEYHDACELRRISMTLHRWFELECGDGNDHGSWCITRGRKLADGTFEHDNDGHAYLEHHHYMHGRGQDSVSYSRLPDREAGAKKRLAKIMNGYSLDYHIQTDPRGASLYILPAGVDAENYNRGIAVYR